MKMLLTRLETLCVEKLEYLITDTNRRFQSLENQLSQSSSCPASPVVQNIENLDVKVENLDVKVENLDVKVENLGKQFSTETQKTIEKIEELMNAARNLYSNVEAIQRNVSSLINVTSSRSLDLPQDLQTPTSTTCPHNLTVQYPRNCREVQESGKTASGTYSIKPEHAQIPFEVVCDLETRGGGWTVIQKRFDGSQDFFLDWQNYKNGFGNLTGEFWLGLEHIHLLTGFEKNELLVELGDFESQSKSAFYSEFSVGSEVEGYSLQVLGLYSGDAGDSLNINAGQKFSTKDNDQHVNSGLNCAAFYNGAWWYNWYAHSNLNGKYFDRGQVPENPEHTMFWYHFKNTHNGLKQTRMLVRPMGYGNTN